MSIKPIRAFYLRQDYQLIRSIPELGIEIYADATSSTILAFAGKRQKPSFHLRFTSEVRASHYVADWVDRLRQSHERKERDRAEKKAFRHTLKVGHVLASTWGYEQTNWNFYEVIKLAGCHTVELRELAQSRVETTYMQGKCAPLPGQYIGEMLRRRVGRGNRVRISSCQLASKLEPVRTIGSIPVYDAKHYTSYA